MRGAGHGVPFDDELRESLEATAAQYRAALAQHLLPALARVRDRGTPLRGAQRHGSIEAVRLRFADGSIFLARAEGRAGLSQAVMAMARGNAVLLTELRADSSGLHAVLTWRGGHRLACEILGGDQAD